MCIPVLFAVFLDEKGHHKSVRKLIGVRFAKYNKVFYRLYFTSRRTAGLDIYTSAVNACLCSPTGNSKTVSFTIGKEAIITSDLYSHNTLVVPFHFFFSSALFR